MFSKAAGLLSARFAGTLVRWCCNPFEVRECFQSDTIEAAFAGKVAYDDLREAMEEIKSELIALSWEVVE